MANNSALIVQRLLTNVDIKEIFAASIYIIRRSLFGALGGLIMKHLIKITLASAILLAGNAFAEDLAEEEKKLGWEGTGEFGLVSTTGSTDTFALNLAGNVIYRTDLWTHRFAATAITSSKDGNDDSKRFTAELQSNRILSAKSYLFGVYRYDADKFGSYDPQQSITAGYGRELVKSENHVLNGEIGVGYRKSEERTTGYVSDNIIARFMLDDAWQVWESTLWTNRLLVESGSDNTFTQFNTGLAVAMTNTLAVKLSFEIRNNTQLPPGETENTDTTTTVNLVYNFGK
jgi:putative salt-induced outer membrane protein